MKFEDVVSYRRHRLNMIIKRYGLDIPVPVKTEDQLQLNYLEKAVQTELLAYIADMHRNAT